MRMLTFWFISVQINAIHLNITQFLAIAMGGDFDKVIGVKAHTVPIDSVIKELKEVKNER